MHTNKELRTKENKSNIYNIYLSFTNVEYKLRGEARHTVFKVLKNKLNMKTNVISEIKNIIFSLNWSLINNEFVNESNYPTIPPERGTINRSNIEHTLSRAWLGHDELIGECELGEAQPGAVGEDLAPGKMLQLNQKISQPLGLTCFLMKFSSQNCSPWNQTLGKFWENVILIF